MFNLTRKLTKKGLPLASLTLVLFGLAGCSGLIPPSTPAPQAWLIQPLGLTPRDVPASLLTDDDTVAAEQQKSDSLLTTSKSLTQRRNAISQKPATYQEAKRPLLLLVEHPLAAGPLTTTNMWYRPEGLQLTPFSSNRWAQSLDKQIQFRISQYLAQEKNISTSLVEAPGFQPNLRLRLSVQDWYINLDTSSLEISLQANLLTPIGQNLASRNWQEELLLEQPTAANLALASQIWLETWAKELTQWIEETTK